MSRFCTTINAGDVLYIGEAKLTLDASKGRSGRICIEADKEIVIRKETVRGAAHKPRSNNNG